MKTNNEIIEWLDHYSEESGGVFDCNRDAILLENSRHQSVFSSTGIKILSVLGSITAASLFMSFLFIMEILNSNVSMLIIGILFLICALAGSSRLSINLSGDFIRTFFDTTIVCLYIIGCTLIAMGTDKNPACCILMLVALITAIVSNKYIMIFLSVLLFNGSFAVLFGFLFEPIVFIYFHLVFLTGVFVYVCSNESRLIKISSKISHLYKPIVTGIFFTLIPMFVIVSTLFASPENEDIFAGIFRGLILALPIFVCIIYLLRQYCMKCGISKKKSMIVCVIASLLLLPAIYTPTISGAILILLLSFRYAHKSIFVISLVLLISAFIQYYYVLNITLLVKSIILFFSGILFLIIWLSLRNSIKS